MKVSSARKWIKQNLPRLQQKFRLEDWEIVVQVDKRLSKDPNDTRLGNCIAKSDYQSAYIWIGVEDMDSSRMLEIAISHELLHCVLSPIDQIRDLMSESTNELAKSVFYKFYYSTIERTVRSLELILGLGIKTAKIV